MSIEITYQLNISFCGADQQASLSKEGVKAWLLAAGITSFVEGSLEDLDIDHEFGQPERDFYGELGGERSPIVVYSYDRSYLSELASRLGGDFGEALACEIAGMETRRWTEGWKESFKPIQTQRFYIHPPWEKAPTEGGLIPLLIDPGMAFGTGQHATTQVCLELIEGLFPSDAGQGWSEQRFLDVGTGSGILAIAAAKLGCRAVDACDIDGDAVMAARANAEANAVDLKLWQGSSPSGAPGYDVVVANILFVVLAKMIAALAAELKPAGRLMLSGLLVEQRAEMLALAEELGLRLVEEADCEGWVALVLSKAV